MRPLLLAALVAACLYGGTAVASPVTFSFAATLTDDPFGLSSFGAPITGTFTFDSAAADAIADPSMGSFASNGVPYGFAVDVDGTSYAIDGRATVVTANDIGVDQYGVVAIDGGLTLELFLQDFTQTALSSDAQPLLPSLAAFGSRRFELFADDTEFGGDLTSLVCTAGCAAPVAVPEPGSLLLIAVGAGAFAIRRRTRPRPPITAGA